MLSVLYEAYDSFFFLLDISMYFGFISLVLWIERGTTNPKDKRPSEIPDKRFSLDHCLKR
jgi:hypothetical protein